MKKFLKIAAAAAITAISALLMSGCMDINAITFLMNP